MTRLKLKIFYEKGHFSNIANVKPTFVSLPYVFIGLGPEIEKSVGVKPKRI